jgi:Tfp pilus assembly protein PilZ
LTKTKGEEIPVEEGKIGQMGKRTHVGIGKFEKDLPPETRTEKRKHTRFLLNLPIEYSCLDSPISYSSHSINASEGGLFICIQQRLKVGQNINLKIYFHPGPNLQNVKTIAQVMWVDELLENEGEYRHGVKFVTITQQDLRQFKSFLDGLSPMI